MTLSQLFAQYGYFVLLLGSLAEGIPVMVFGGFAAHRGWLVFAPHVVLAGALGNFAAWCVWFFAVRALGTKVLERRPDWAKPVAAMRVRLERWEVPTVIGARALPGINSAAIIAAALSGISTGRFLLWNAVGALLWALGFGTLGYALGQVIETVLGEIERYEEPVAVALIGAGVVWIAYHQWRRSRRTAISSTPATTRPT